MVLGLKQINKDGTVVVTGSEGDRFLLREEFESLPKDDNHFINPEGKPSEIVFNLLERVEFIRAYLGIKPGDDYNAAFVDRSTFETAAKIVTNELPPSPFYLYDLNCLLTGVIFFDRVYIPKYYPDEGNTNRINNLNRGFGEDVFIELDFVDAPELIDDYLYYHYSEIANKCCNDYENFNIKHRRAWQAILGPLADTIKFDHRVIDSTKNSPPAFITSYQSFDDAEKTNLSDFLETSVNDGLLSFITFRALQNFEVCNDLNLSYLPNCLRAVVYKEFCPEESSELLANKNLALVSLLKKPLDAFIEETNEVNLFGFVSYRLPVALSTYLHRAVNSNERNWEPFFFLRRTAAGYRKVLSIYLESIYPNDKPVRNPKEIVEISKQLESELSGLDATMGTKAKNHVKFLLGALSFIYSPFFETGIYKIIDLIPKNIAGRLLNNILKPQIRTLLNIKETASEALLAEDFINAIWGRRFNNREKYVLDRISENYPIVS